MRKRAGKSARLASKDFDRTAVNDVTVEEEPVEAEVEVVETPAEEKAEEKPAEEPKAEEKA